MPTTGLFTCHSVEFVIRHTFFHEITQVPNTCDFLKAYRMDSWKMCHCMCVKTCYFSRMVHHVIFTCCPRPFGPTIWATVDRSWLPDCLACMFSRLDHGRLWVHMKSLNYDTPVATEEDLLAQVMAATDIGGPRIGDRVYQKMVRRYRICVDVGGRHIKLFL